MHLVRPSPPVGPAEQLEGGTVKGGVLVSHLDWVRENAGDAASISLIREVASRTKCDIPHDFIAHTKAYPFRVLIALDRLIEEQYRGTFPDIIRSLGRHSAAKNHSRDTHSIDALLVHAYFERSVRISGMFHDFMKLRYERIGSRTGSFTHLRPACFSPVFCRSSIGYYEECVHLHGARSVEIRESSCRCLGASDCVFEFTWEQWLRPHAMHPRISGGVFVSATRARTSAR